MLAEAARKQGTLDPLVFTCYGEVQNPAKVMAFFVTASSASTESPLAPAPPRSACDVQSYTGVPPAKGTTPKWRVPQVYPFARSEWRSRLVAQTPQRAAGPALVPVVLPKAPVSSILEARPTALLSTATSLLLKEVVQALAMAINSLNRAASELNSVLSQPSSLVSEERIAKRVPSRSVAAHHHTPLCVFGRNRIRGLGKGLLFTKLAAARHFFAMASPWSWVNPCARTAPEQKAKVMTNANGIILCIFS
jgi:hypothetical protein